MEQTITFVNNLGLKLAGIISMPKSDDKLPLVVMCHGYASGKNSKINRLLVPKLNDLGIASYYQGSESAPFSGVRNYPILRDNK